MKWSLSSVRVYNQAGQTCLFITKGLERVRRHAWNEMEAGWTPTLESWRCSQNVIGFEASMVVSRYRGPLIRAVLWEYEQQKAQPTL